MKKRRAVYGFVLAAFAVGLAFMPMVMGTRRAEEVGEMTQAGVLYAGPATEADLAPKTFHNVDGLVVCLQKLGGGVEIERDEGGKVERLLLVPETQNIELRLEKGEVTLGAYVVQADGVALQWQRRAFDPEGMPFLGDDDFYRARGKALRLCK